MRKVISIISAGIIVVPGCALIGSPAMADAGGVVDLPAPRERSDTSVEQALKTRRSTRTFGPAALTLEELSQLLWAAQGIRAAPFRTAPSAGALYPLEVYVAVGDVESLEAGVYRYDSAKHVLRNVKGGDVRKSLANAAHWQKWIAGGAAVLVISAVYDRTTKKYGERGIRYAHMEAGHAAQNVYLQARALALGTVVVGAFRDGRVRRLLRMQDDEQPLSIMPVGRPLD